MNQISNILKKLEAGVKQCETWMMEWDKFFLGLELVVPRNLPVWPLRWLQNFSDFRSTLKKIVNFQNMNWLDGVGLFQKDEVYKNDSLYKKMFALFDSSRLSMCLSPSGRFLFMEPEKKNKRSFFDWLMNDDSDSVTMQMGVIDLLLGEYYLLDIDCLSGVCPYYSHADFIGFYALKDSNVVILDNNPDQGTFRQRVICIDHHRRKAQCPGHRVFQRRLASSLTSFHHGYHYCAVYDGFEDIIRFAEDPAESSASTKDGSLTTDENFQIIDPHKFFFSDAAPGDLFFPVLLKSVSHSFSIQNAAFNEQGFLSEDKGPILLKQQGSSMVYSKPDYNRPPAYRVVAFFNYLMITCTLSKICVHQIFEPHYAFSYLFYYRLTLFYFASSCAEELYSCIRKVLVDPIFFCAFDTQNWRWVNFSKACGSQGSLVCGKSQEVVFYNSPEFMWPLELNRSVSFSSSALASSGCPSLMKIAEMKLQRFPNVVLKTASRALIQQLNDC